MTIMTKLILSACLFFLIFTQPSLYAEESTEEQQQQQQAYQLGSGDILKITVFNQEDLSGEYTVSGSGKIALPLIGSITVKGITLLQLKQKIVKKLKPDYLLNPRISIEMLNYRPFYILGEIKNPQSYPYVDGMSYLNAIAIAGGYTYRAKKDYVLVIRMNDVAKNEIKLKTEDKVMPGDVIRVDERFF